MLLIYRIYFILIALPILVTWTILTALFTFVACCLGGRRWAGYYPPMLWARLFCILTWVRVKVKGRENIDKHCGYMFVANHQGAYDIFSVYGYLEHNFRWMMKQSLRKIPFVGFACAACGQIFVDNRSTTGVRHTMAAAEKQLSSGMSLVVFPEGSRTPDGRMHRFKKGAYKLAEEFKMPVVPVTIDGAYRVMPRQALLPQPGRIVLTIHRPIAPHPENGHDMETLIERSRQAIASALPNP